MPSVLWFQFGVFFKKMGEEPTGCKITIIGRATKSNLVSCYSPYALSLSHACNSPSLMHALQGLLKWHYAIVEVGWGTGLSFLSLS